MENENKWEYDYSSANNSQNTAGETGYPNVGSSGMNTANTAATYGEADTTNPEYTAPRQDSGNGGVTPPPAGPEQNAAAPGQPKKQKKDHSKLAKSAVALVLAAAMGFVGGFAGAQFGNGGHKVVIQQVERSDSSAASDSVDAAADGTTVSSSMTTAQVAKMVSPSVVVITTEQVVYSQWSWYGQSQVESGAGSGVIISSDGYILTCDHVVSGASNITVTIGDDDYTATVVGEDSTSDVAVLKIDANGLTPAVPHDSRGQAGGVDAQPRGREPGGEEILHEPDGGQVRGAAADQLYALGLEIKFGPECRLARVCGQGSGKDGGLFPVVAAEGPQGFF